MDSSLQVSKNLKNNPTNKKKLQNILNNFNKITKKKIWSFFER